jgi:hypothetical protein
MSLLTKYIVSKKTKFAIDLKQKITASQNAITIKAEAIADKAKKDVADALAKKAKADKEATQKLVKAKAAKAVNKLKKVKK